MIFFTIILLFTTVLPGSVAPSLCTSIGCRLIPTMSVSCCARYYECCLQYEQWLVDTVLKINSFSLFINIFRMQAITTSDISLEMLHQMAGSTLSNLYTLRGQSKGKPMF